MNSLRISYKIGCRDCLRGEASHMYNVIDSDVNDYLHKTEYEVMTLVENWRKEDNHKCLYCRSSNIEVLDVAVNDNMLYDYNKIIKRCSEKREEILEISINKIDFELDMQLSGSESIEINFLKIAILKIVNTIRMRPTNQFKSLKNGHFFVCISGKVVSFRDQNSLRIESFNSFGLIREEIFKAMEPLIEQSRQINL